MKTLYKILGTAYLASLISGCTRAHQIGEYTLFKTDRTTVVRKSNGPTGVTYVDNRSDGTLDEKIEWTLMGRPPMAVVRNLPITEEDRRIYRELIKYGEK